MRASGAGGRAQGFAPVARADARVLVLGSLPGVASIAAGQYYAHPRNAFWPIMRALFGIAQDDDYAAHCRALVRARVALWDVLAASRRHGSLDAAIDEASAEVNPFPDFLDAHSRLRVVFFNGAKAEALWRRRVAPGLGQRAAALRLVRLPSTSPAHAAMPFGDKLARWCVVRDAAQR